MEMRATAFFIGFKELDFQDTGTIMLLNPTYVHTLTPISAILILAFAQIWEVCRGGLYGHYQEKRLITRSRDHCDLDKSSRLSLDYTSTATLTLNVESGTGGPLQKKEAFHHI